MRRVMRFRSSGYLIHSYQPVSVYSLRCLDSLVSSCDPLEGQLGTRWEKGDVANSEYTDVLTL